MSKKKPNTTRRTLYYYWQITKKYGWYNFGAVFGQITVILLRNTILTLLISDIIEGLSQGLPTDEAAKIVFPKAVLAIVSYASAQAIGQLRTFCNWKSEILGMYDLANMAFNTICYQSMQFHVNRFSGSLVSQTNQFVRAYERLMDMIVWNLVPLATDIISVVVVLSFKVPAYAVSLVIFVCIFIAISVLTSKKMNELSNKMSESESKATGQLADSISNINAVKSYARENHERKRYADYAHKQRVATLNFMRANILRNIKYDIVYIAINTVGVVALVLGGLYWGMPISLLFLIISYTWQVMDRLWDITGLLKDTKRVFSDAKQMTEILDLEDDVVDMPGATKLEIKDASIKFDDITFKHHDAKEAIFENFTLDIKPGERIGLVGVSGSGKTTLTKLLLRFADVNEGEISIDGQNIKYVTQDSLRKNIAYVPQETALFHRSISENISYGKPDATFTEIEHAAKLANADEFIKNLPNGYETLVGERGIKLSGGQRQRIAIARAILKNAPVLVLDEATSALDSESEALIQGALRELIKGRTAIVIAHRLSTVMDLDRIIVLEDGKIAESGSHAELLKKGGAYAKLWSRQSGAFLDED